MTDIVYVSFDSGGDSIPVLTVGKTSRERGVELINTVYGEEALKLYAELVGMISFESVLPIKKASEELDLLTRKFNSPEYVVDGHDNWFGYL